MFIINYIVFIIRIPIKHNLKKYFILVYISKNTPKDYYLIGKIYCIAITVMTKKKKTRDKIENKNRLVFRL